MKSKKKGPGNEFSFCVTSLRYPGILVEVAEPPSICLGLPEANRGARRVLFRGTAAEALDRL